MKKWIKTQWNKYVVNRTIDSSCPGSRNFVPSPSPFLPPSSRKTCRLFPLLVFRAETREVPIAHFDHTHYIFLHHILRRPHTRTAEHHREIRAHDQPRRRRARARRVHGEIDASRQDVR